ncbi:integral membrane protein [Aspergillus sclerotialis]|uniref:Integral membrane protein n=1 Tax=Aspergillus sclerotialis TaxID=2070753 RepID=A0A3A2ZG66_9EURO|nr:integral membrane protein [Aspergillus sclerotialis]
MSGHSLLGRDFWSQGPPDFRSREDDNPTLLISWWATIFSLVIIIIRVCGRYIRIERFFTEDLVMMASVIPLLIRMALVHVVLLWGTNNTKNAGLTLEEIHHREIGSRLVLAARIFYAIFIWTAKFTVCEFLKRVSGMIWRRSIQRFLRFIYYFLASTLVAVVIATLAECQPFSHYWQVVPDPGIRCRSGYANLITMGTCDIITDLLLVAFPVPIILMTQMPFKRKASLVVLFALSLILVAITSYRVPSVISHNGSQQYRSLLASLEILAATAVSNAVVIGSFVRDKGVKKLKFKKALASASVSENMDQSSVRRATITHHQWGSDSDLAGDLGIRLEPELYYSDGKIPRPPPVVGPYHPLSARTGTFDSNWSFKRHSLGSEDSKVSATDSIDIKVSPHEYIETNKTPRKKSADINMSSRRVSFYDPGGLLSDSDNPAPSSNAHDLESNPEFPTTTQTRSLSSSLQAPISRIRSSPIHQSPPNFTRSYTNGRIYSYSNGRRPSNYSSSSWETPAPPYRSQPDVTGPIMEADDVELQDVGGLLQRNT